VALWSARHRWPVFALWFVLTLGLFAFSLGAGGTRTTGPQSEEGETRLESYRAYEIFDASRTEEPSQSFLLILASESRSVEDPVFREVVSGSVERLSGLTVQGPDGPEPALEQVVDPLTIPPGAGPSLVSADRRAVRIPARVVGETDEVDRKLDVVMPEVERLVAAYPDITIRPLNSRLANDEIIDLVNEDLDSSLLLTIPLTFLILLVAFGAVVAAVVPLVLAVSALLAAFGVLGLYSQVVSPVAEFSSQLIVLIGLAVAVDYSLFMISRFRTERRRGREKLAAIGIASSTAGRAVLFSGLAVMFSIAGLFILDDVTLRAMAVGTIAVVLIAVLGSLTFLPATLAILGGGVDRGRIPFFGREREEGRGAWSMLVRAVSRRPIVSAVLSSALLLAIATPAVRLHLGESDLSAFPSSLRTVQAAELLAEKWPEGTTLELQVVVTRADEPGTQAAIERLNDAVLAIDGVSGPPRADMSADGRAAMVSYVLSGSQNDEGNRRIVRQVRGQAVPAVFGALPGTEALVTGDVATTLDEVDYFAGSMPLVLAFVLGLSFMLLLVAFRSVVIPLKAIILNLLSAAAAYGVLVLVFQDGWFADLLDVKPGIVEEFVPIFIFTILFGLSMDYHVFILTRIKEARDRGLSSDDAVVRGIAITSGTITSAAAIMVVVFAVFVTLRLVVVKELGLGLAVAVLLDATVVRTVLLPATMRLLGDWNWWLPRWLEWIPRVTVEGVSDDDEGLPDDEPARAFAR
jgi:uncharacterized membrane protein YdfJ with MMPL/SSD domain